jgi:hypothetical protein
MRTLLRASGGVLAVAAVFSLASAALAQTTLQPGDIGITNINADDPDSFGLVLLRNILSGTTFTVTDNGFNGTSLATTEGNVVFTAPSDLAAGTVLSFVSGTPGSTSAGFGTPTGSFALAVAGDSLIVYQGTSTSPTFIAALATGPFRTTGTLTANDTYLPTNLTAGFSAVALGGTRNADYNGARTGSASALRSSLFTASSFTQSATRLTPNFSNFTVTATSVPEAGTFALVGMGALPLVGAFVARRRKAA